MIASLSTRRFAAAIGVTVSLAALAVDRTQADPGSLLIYPAVEISWNAAGEVTQDTLITLTNGTTREVRVRLYYVNGDAPLPAQFGPGGVLIERAHPGWNNRGCGITLSAHQSTYWSALTGQPGACRFTSLDLGPPPGRPDPDHPGGRTLRGFLYLWAVDEEGREINWNHLRGDATVFQFNDGGAWAYEAVGFRALIGARGDLLPESGVLRMDGIEYEKAFARLLMNFSAVGEVPLFGDSRLFHVDTDLTLLPVSQDFRQDHDDPVTTKAKFDIYNMDETFFSGTDRCITCWDQSLLSRYDAPNNFVYEDMHTELGSAHIQGIPSGVVCGPESVDSALLGVAVRVVSFPAAARTADWTGDGLTGLDDQSAFAACLSGPESDPTGPQCPPVFDLDGDGDVDVRDFALMPFAAPASRTYSAVHLIGEGTKSAIIRYDAPE